jgi:hypothetical protein
VKSKELSGGFTLVTTGKLAALFDEDGKLVHVTSTGCGCLTCAHQVGQMFGVIAWVRTKGGER